MQRNCPGRLPTTGTGDSESEWMERQNSEDSGQREKIKMPAVFRSTSHLAVRGTWYVTKRPCLIRMSKSQGSNHGFP